jgi:hypothetical protein
MTQFSFSNKAKQRKVSSEVSVYDRYYDAVNMTYSELLRWSRTPCSYKASLDRTPIERNLILLHKKRSDWDIFDENAAKRTLSSKRDVSLLNWGYDPRKEF